MKPLHNLTIAFALAAAAVLLTSLYLENKNDEITINLEAKIAVQKEKLDNLIELSDQSTASRNNIIMACEADLQKQFDKALVGMVSQSKAELERTRLLLIACAYAAPAQKALAVSRLLEVTQELKSYIEILSLMQPAKTFIDYSMTDVDYLLDLEGQQADLSRKRVDIQLEIIDELIAGASPAAEAIQTKVLESQELLQTYSVLNSQTKELKTKLNES